MLSQSLWDLCHHHQSRFFQMLVNAASCCMLIVLFCMVQYTRGGSTICSSFHGIVCFHSQGQLVHQLSEIFFSITAAVHTLGVQWKFLDLYAKQKECEGYSKASVAQLRGVLSRSLNQETEYNRITQRALSVLKGEYKEQYKQYLLEQLPY